MSQDPSSVAAGFVEGEPVSSRRRRRSCAGGGRSPSSKLSPSSAAEAVEAVVAQDLAPGALGRPLTLAGADEHDDLAVGHAAQQPLDERGSEEARRPGHGDSPAGELVAYHGSVSSTRVPKGLANSAAEMAHEMAAIELP